MPVFLILEDAHWIDPTTQELLQPAVAAHRSAAGHARRHPSAGMAGGVVGDMRPSRTISLGRLDREQIAVLMTRIMGRQPDRAAGRPASPIGPAASRCSWRS